MARKRKSEPSEILVVNDTPGEETRVAIVQDGHLEELYSERAATATSVGNIYKGKVTNVESAIQAAFVDFGHGQNGFLHISDLHPKYFPGEEVTERVGRKIPRRRRPAMQDCLKRGQEILVQVLKEGIGTKGPTLTSYLSIPGRLLVAMPYMERVGVSRKVEDDERRRAMRKILDDLELPDDMGFILRTAGLDRTKTELKRDVAYLQRLWKLMKKRMETVKAPCELYTESDLVIRTVRDVLRPSINAIVVDSESAHERVSAFIRVVAPRSAPQVVRYHRATPIFHAFDLERQIEMIHSRSVPLQSGGSIIIEQTEALVAIDVNSGKSLRARDSETNAYETNCEAVDEICRQLRLRDLGGLVINDLIDMRMQKNRRLIEERIRENLKRDRAKSTALNISEFGILEMTRQRMRPSMRKTHFITCPHCEGHGDVMSPDSVATRAVRHMGYLLQYDEIKRIEMVCSPRVASVLLGTKRRTLVQLEDETSKKVDVRVSDAFAADRVDFYAYNARNADVNVERLKPLSTPRVDELVKEEAAAIASDDLDQAADGTSKRKRSRRRRKAPPADATAVALAVSEELDAEEAERDEQAEPAKKKRRRRGGRRRKPAADAAATDLQTQPVSEPASRDHVDEADTPDVAAAVTEDAKPLRVHVIAKELGVASREVLQRCEEDDRFELKNHMSSVDGAQAETIRDWFNEDVTEAAQTVETATDGAPQGGAGDSDQAPSARKKRSRRGRRGGRGRNKASRETASQSRDGVVEPADSQAKDADPAQPEVDHATNEQSDGPPKRGKKRRRRGRRSGKDTALTEVASGSEASADGASKDGEPSDAAPLSKKKRTRRRTKKKTSTTSPATMDAGAGGAKSGSSNGAVEQSNSSTSLVEDKPQAKPAKKRRALYGAHRRVSPTARSQGEQRED